MLVRPLINRELLRECRRKMHFVARTVFVLALALYVTWRWMEIGAYSRQNVQTMMARYGTSLFIAWAVVQYLVIWALSTVRAAGLADERRIGSLQLMRTTALLDHGVIIGWFLSVMGRALFTMALALPVLVMSRSFGGFTLSQVGVVLAITILSTAVSAAFTLCLAATSNSTGNALISSIVLQVLLLMGLQFFGFSILVGSPWRVGGLTLLGISIQDLSFARQFAHLFVALRLVLIAVWLCLAVRLLKRPVSRFGRPVKRLLNAADDFFLRFSKNKCVLWRSGLGECKRNPILWRERAVSVLGQRDHVIRIWYTPAIVLIVISLLTLALSGAEMAIFFLVVGLFGIPVLLVALFLVVPTAMTFVRERQRKTLGLLAATPLSARDILVGKYLFCLRRLAVPLALGVAVVVMAIFAQGSWRGFDDMIPLYLLPAFVPLFLAEMLYVTEGAQSAAKAITAAAVTLAAVAQLANDDLVDSLAWEVSDFFNLPVTVYLPAIAFAVAAAILARRVRLMRYGLFIGVVSWSLVMAMGGAYDAMRHKPFCQYGLVGGCIVSAVALAAVVAIDCRRKFRMWRWYALFFALVSAVILAVLWVKDFDMTGAVSRAGLPLLSIALLVAFLRAMRFCGPGVVNRTILAVMAHWLVFGWISALGSEVFMMWILVFPAIALMIYVFLKLGIAQLDPLMGRNG